MHQGMEAQDALLVAQDGLLQGQEIAGALLVVLDLMLLGQEIPGAPHDLQEPIQAHQLQAVLVALVDNIQMMEQGKYIIFIKIFYQFKFMQDTLLNCILTFPENH